MAMDTTHTPSTPATAPHSDTSKVYTLEVSECRADGSRRFVLTNADGHVELDTTSAKEVARFLDACKI